MAIAKTHTDLRDRSKSFSIAILGITKDIQPDHTEKEVLKRLINSGITVGINTELAFKSQPRSEFNSHLSIVIDQVLACKFCIDLLINLNTDINLKSAEEINNEASELISIFTSLIKKSN